MRTRITRSPTIVWCMLWANVAAAQTTTGLSPERVVSQLGKFHPLILHFPIVIITLLPLVLLVSRLPRGHSWIPTIPWFIHLGALSAVVAALLGLAAARDWAGGVLTPALLWHRNLTLATTTIMVLLSLYTFLKKPDFSRTRAAILLASLLATLALTLGAHLGAEAVHGRTFILFSPPEKAEDYR